MGKTMLLRVLPLICCWFLMRSCVEAGHVHTNSFPTYEEYDYSILDPLTVYGSPLGGFSRASRSRLAALPLHLPEVSEEDPTNLDPVYMRVRDATGRLFACRVYHEDELDPNSLHESMFDAPKFRSEASTDLTPTKQSDDTASAGSSESSASSSSSSSSSSKKEIASGKAASDDSASPSSSTSGKAATAMLVLEAVHRLRNLKGICAQIHKGWWSYEWCYELHVTQFHIDLDPYTHSLLIQDISKLGKYHERAFWVDLEHAPVNELAKDSTELVRVIDTHVGGDLCPDTGRPRTSYVKIQCCSPKVMEDKNSLLHQNGIQLLSGLAAMVDIEEDPDQICVYNVTVCTPLLCADTPDPSATADGNSLVPKTTGTGTGSSRKTFTVAKENESIREILDRTLGTWCVQSNPGGWWTYEICHGNNIRQFHEVIGQHKSKSGTSMTSRIVESEHILGNYNPEQAESFPVEEEYKHVINATDAKGGGNGAYYEIEYTGGDLCEGEDVKDSAIVAGTVGASAMARASSVRYYCGGSYQVSVSEDSTCHYIVEVKVPDLCRHPLFKVPVAKKQIVKCLPVEGYVGY